MLPKLSFPLRRGVLHVQVPVSFSKYGLTALTIFGHKQRSPRGFSLGATRKFSAMLTALCYDLSPSFMDSYGHCLRTITSVDVRN